MMDYNKIKSNFQFHFRNELTNYPKLKFLLLDIFVYGSAYIVGGYLRDFINNKNSRDMDIIVDLDNDKLMSFIDNSNINYVVNRHKGIKLHLDNLEVDIWSIENNWAFKNKLVQLNEKDKLNSIAKGSFYNYDALVINLHTFNLNIKYYNSFIKNKELDILQKSSKYKNINPTTNANILRAFYLKKMYNIKFSKNTKQYLIKKIGKIRDDKKNPIEELERTKLEYSKYNIALDNKDITNYVDQLFNENTIENQTFLKL